MLVSSKELVDRAYQQKWAVGAFNAVNMETAQAIFRAADETDSPFILQVTSTTLDYTEPETLVALITSLGNTYRRIPWALHLDHGRTLETVVQFIRLGFTSVMIDGSLKIDQDGKPLKGPDAAQPIEENIRITQEAVRIARSVGVSVEGEVGVLGQLGVEISKESKNKEKALTDPDEAFRFVKATGVDMLAVGIGTKHGLYSGKPEIDHKRLAEIANKAPVPLVMHGGTGVPDEDVKKAIELGIAKVNIDTQIRVAGIETLKQCIHAIEKEHSQADADAKAVRKYDLRAPLLAPMRQAMQKAVAEKMILFGSAGKA